MKKLFLCAVLATSFNYSLHADVLANSFEVLGTLSAVAAAGAGLKMMALAEANYDFDFWFGVGTVTVGTAALAIQGYRVTKPARSSYKSILETFGLVEKQEKEQEKQGQEENNEV